MTVLAPLLALSLHSIGTPCYCRKSKAPLKANRAADRCCYRLEPVVRADDARELVHPEKDLWGKVHISWDAGGYLHCLQSLARRASRVKACRDTGLVLGMLSSGMGRNVIYYYGSRACHRLVGQAGLLGHVGGGGGGRGEASYRRCAFCCCFRASAPNFRQTPLFKTCINIKMTTTRRIDSFVGGDVEYARYLLGLGIDHSLPAIIEQLENFVIASRGANSGASPGASLGASLDLKPTWRTKTASFFKSLPVSEQDWTENRTATRFLSQSDILSTTKSLISGPAVSAMPLQDALESIAKNAASPRAANTTRFHELIFLAICTVALGEGHPEESVNRAQLVYLAACGRRSDRSSKRLMTDRALVIWLLQAMRRQFRRGLLHRAFEIFFICKPICSCCVATSPEPDIIVAGQSLSFYESCPKTKDSEEFAGLFPTFAPDEIHASVPLWIPFLIKSRVGSLWR